MESPLESLAILNIAVVKLAEIASNTAPNANGRSYPKFYAIPEGAIGSVVIAPTDENASAVVCYNGRTFAYPDFLSKVKVEYMFVHSLEEALKYGGIERPLIKNWPYAGYQPTPIQNIKPSANNTYKSPGTILNGLRGQTFLEAGYVYAPYTPLITTPLIYAKAN